jgi:hypothetical protein
LNQEFVNDHTKDIGHRAISMTGSYTVRLLLMAKETA